MSKRLLKTMAALLAIAAAAAGPAWGQNSSPDVTLDFTTNTWGLPTSGSNHGPESYSNGTYSITLSATVAYRLNSGYLLLGKDGSYLQLPAFSSPVEKIEVVGHNGASASVKQNIYVGETAVSTQTTGARETNTYVIDEDYRAAGNIYTLRVENAYNTQITYIKVYYAGGSTPEPEPEPAVPHTVRLAAGTEDAGNWTLASGNASVTGTAVLENVMSGSQVTATYNGTTKKVKSVKAVKYVVPPTPLDNTMTAWADGKYAVPAGGLTYGAAITVSGEVTLVLTDGTTLTLNKGISLASGATLTVQGTGTMNVKGSNGNTSSTTGGSGTITLMSGTLTATGGNGGNVGNFSDESHGGAGGAAINGTVIVDGGTLTATGGNGGNVGNSSNESHGGAGGAAISGSVTVNGGTLTATGGNGGNVGGYSDFCSGGAGGAAIGGSLTINAGTMTTTNGAAGSVGGDSDFCSGGAAGKAVVGTVTDNR